MTPGLASRICCILAACALWLAACIQPETPEQTAARLAAAGGLLPRRIATARFELAEYEKIAHGTNRIRIYIEGDGHAWRTRAEPSDDPTPWDPMALALAARDGAPSVAWLGRPCQYVSPMPAGCAHALWTNERYGETVVSAMNEAVERIRAGAGASHIELVGFSGGGVVAALIAARRDDVVSLRTVAANLDTSAWTDGNSLAPLTGSLNPADQAARLAGLPQLHFVGGRDPVVGPSVVEAYASRFPSRACLEVVSVPNAGHDEGWAEMWPDLVRREPRCVPP
jgi:pimeloyl-ACP methyl ester carboxylesterase